MAPGVHVALLPAVFAACAAALTATEPLGPVFLSAHAGDVGTFGALNQAATHAAHAQKPQPLPRGNPLYFFVGVAAGLAVILVLGAWLSMKGGCVGGDSGGGKGAGSKPGITAVALVPRFKVHSKRGLDEFRGCFESFFQSIHPEAEGMLYYGFTVDEANLRVVCREAYKDADGVLNHLQNCDEALKAALEIGTLESLEAHGPADQLKRLRKGLKPLGCRFFVTDAGSLVHGVTEPVAYAAGVADRSVMLAPRFAVPEGRMEEFRKLFREFSSSMEPEKEGALFYGFSVDDENGLVLCREAYRDADGVLAHLSNVDSVFKKALNIARLDSLEAHGPPNELSKLRSTLEPLGCAFFEADAGCITWMNDGAADPLQDTDVGDLLMTSCTRMFEQLQTKVDKGSRARDIVEARLAGIQEKAKDFVLRELNNTAAAVLKAIDGEESKTILEFNAAVDASFPPVSVFLAGVLSPAILSLSLSGHMLQFLFLFLPVFVLSLWAAWEDYGETCDIPTMVLLIWVTLCVSFFQVVGHGLLAATIASGQSALQVKTAEIKRRWEENAADGETGFSDMQELFIGSAVLIQDALIVEDSVRRSVWVDVVGVATLLWIIAVLWNFVLVVGWTFVPGAISFHTSSHHTAEGAFCGAWASVFAARVICLCTPVFFFLNIASLLHWIMQKAIHSQGVSSAVLEFAKDFDRKNGGVPVMSTLAKAVVLRAGSDASKAKLTVALGEALRLTKERDDAKAKLDQVTGRIQASRIERRTLKTIAKRSGGNMQAHLEMLEQTGDDDTSAWKAKGQKMVQEAERRASMGQEAARDQLDRIVQWLTELMEKVQNNPQVRAALEKAKKTAIEAKAQAAEGLAQAKEAAEAAAAHAAEHAKEAAEYAQAHAHEAAEAGLAFAQGAAEKAQTGLDYAQAHAHEAAEAGRAIAQGAAEKAQTGIEAGRAAASKAAAEAQKAAAQYKK